MDILNMIVVARAAQSKFLSSSMVQYTLTGILKSKNYIIYPKRYNISNNTCQYT